VASCADVANARPGAKLRVAGIVLIRQRPGKGNAIFVTLEDETGVTNIIMWARTLEMFRRAVMASRLMLVEGEVQKSPEGVVHVMAARIIDRTELLDQLAETEESAAQPRAGHPRNVRILPKSRDFH
jgi:error-prone DNA polymerase